ncbi:MAG: MmgE/PrpD family protein [Alphaproteobacteria bacterium]|nr:MmgE/PrpD family protein [Alphaproteobacteria bacterium]
MPDVTRRLAEKLAGLGAGELDPAALGAVRQLVLDGIAVATAGAGEEEAIGILVAHAREQGGAAQASIIAGGLKTNVVAATMVNGAAMHVLDFEPMWSPANHALSTTLPAVLALAEHRDLPGREVAAALAKGCEIQGWIRQASRQFEPRKLVFHPPSVVGPIGAAVAAGHLIGLDGQRLAWAMGIAASRAGGLLANVGTMTKCTHCGHAAALGLEAALLAERGFTGNAAIFDAVQGFVDGFGNADFVREELLNVGPPWRIVAPGYALKMYPSQYGTHFAITAALAVRAQLPDPAAIRRVSIISPRMPYIDRAVPATGLDGKFSLQYTAAAALLDGAVGIATFTDARLNKPDMREMLARITLEQRADIPAHFEAMHLIVTAELADGSTRTARCDGPPGIWGGAKVSAEAHMAKARDCLGLRHPPARVDEIVALARGIDTLDAGGVRALMALLAA